RSRASRSRRRGPAQLRRTSSFRRWLANDTRFGLQASVFTANNRKAIRAARAIRAGTVTVNCYGEGSVATPFGGFGLSGFGGRDNGIAAHDQFTETKTIWIDLNDPADGDDVG
ncbi:MAG: aldehyde dehydrogenase family protein, partial [Pseudomonadota bacterium]